VVIRHNNVIIDRESRTVQVGGRIRNFTHKGGHSPFHPGNYFFKVVCHLILNGWTSRQQLFDFVFASGPEGGPLSGSDTLDVQLCHWRPKLLEVGLHIIRDKRAGIVWYKIQEIPVDA